ncbi:hypothetical protein LCGC14_2096230 [marine sediment metagenome]|uniref:Uncharacterized protein n=1 Tax=marine sediment metagenome TaxID=412755 RepID=A0A0F9EBA5_9ZZZZ
MTKMPKNPYLDPLRDYDCSPVMALSSGFDEGAKAQRELRKDYRKVPSAAEISAKVLTLISIWSMELSEEDKAGTMFEWWLAEELHRWLMEER